MKNFDIYAKYYNLLYKDKDYEKESLYVLELLKKYSPAQNTILNLGCGTGNHDNFFKENNIYIDGVDLSLEMIDAAITNNQGISSGTYFHGDIRNWRHPENKKYDNIMSLFHVMSYQTLNDDFYQTLETVEKHLKKDGVFIFDYWYGPAVHYLKPENKVKIIEDEKLKLIRITNTEFNNDTCCVNVNFEMHAIDKKDNRLLESFSEEHIMRCYFINELSALLKNKNFEIVESLEWKTNKLPNKETWNAITICRKK